MEKEKYIQSVNKRVYTFKPQISVNPNIREMFHDQSAFASWVKKNQIYLNRHIEKI